MTGGPPRRIAFLGFGLIAGSIAKALAGSGGHGRPTLIGWSPSNVGPDAAVRDGTLDAAAGEPAEALEGADLVVIGAPPVETLSLIATLGGPLRSALDPDAVVTDLASTKARVLDAAVRARLRFVGGHPMAGREVAGYANAVPDLFADRPWVLIPAATADEAALDRVTWLATACGARIVRMDAVGHDAAAAAISHLPLFVAAALAEAVAGAATEHVGWPAAAPLAASGWRDMTRLAHGDPRMGAGIATTNAEALAAGLREVREVLDAWITDLEREAGPAPADIETRLRAIRDRLERAAAEPA